LFGALGFLSSAATLLFPMAAKAGLPYLVAIRILQVNIDHVKSVVVDKLQLNLKSRYILYCV
jgi:hypothetical protein